MRDDQRLLNGQEVYYRVGEAYDSFFSHFGRLDLENRKIFLSHILRQKNVYETAKGIMDTIEKEKTNIENSRSQQ